MALTLSMLMLLGFMMPIDVHAATITAASCSAADVQTALNRAAAGDTINIPAGTCRWTTQVSWNAPANVHLKGAGDSTMGGGDKTVIIDNYKPSTDRYHTTGPLFAVQTSATGKIRISGITFKADKDNSNYKYALIAIYGQNKQFRVDHIRVDLLNGVYPDFNYAVTTAFDFWGHITGVVDHSLFDFPDRGGAFIVNYNNYGGGTEGDESWAAPTGLGTSDFLFFEDNKITNLGNGGTVNDCYRAGKWVVRYNTIEGSGAGQTHPTGGSHRARGCRAWEAYKNTLLPGQNGRATFNAFFISSGAGVLWGNSAPSHYSNFVTLHSMRFDTKTYTQAPVPEGWGQYPSVFDAAGAPMDQPGKGRGDLLSGAFPGIRNTATGCGASQACIQPRQTIEGVYEWDNTWVTAGGGSKMAVYEPAVLIANRDYFLHEPNFNGTSGVGTGVLGNRPGTCTTGVGYWATDTNTLYKCTSTNTWSSFYTPYIYPHPLVSDQTAASLPPAPPPGDTTAPTPGSAGLLASSVVGNIATITWNKATDDTSLQPALQYEVRLSTSNDIDTVSKAEAYGAVVQPYAVDISSATIPGLTAGATYYFNVIVKDEAGNKSIYALTSATAPMVDTIAPLPGNSGTMTSNATISSVNLGWAKATDNVSPQSLLQYEVRRSITNNIGSVATAETNGVVVRTYMTDSTSASVAGLSPSTTYYFNVIVKDAAGNKSVYLTRSVTTAAALDSTAPIPGNGGAITSSSVGSNSVTLSWMRSTDDTSPQSQLFYEVRRSSSDNIDTVLRAEAYGAVVLGYSADVASANMTGLTPNTTYFFNVIVKDAAGNRATYLTRSVTTATFMDTSAPTPGSSGVIAIASVGSTGLTLNWNKATDNTTAPAQLLYEVRRSLANNIETVARAEANGIVVQNSAADIGSTSVTGLTTGVTYFFNVTVTDTAGNKAVYRTASVTTIGDTIPPVPGNFGQMTSSANSSSITLNWTKANDTITAQSALRYEVRISSSNNINTVAKAELNGTIAKAYTADLTTYTVTGLSSGTDYYLTVIVKDEANNKAAYVTRVDSTTGRRMTQMNPNGRGSKADDLSIAPATPADTTAPIPGGSGLISVSGISASGLTLRWTTATDDRTPKASLQYAVLESGSKNINTVAQAESNGNVLLGFTADASSFVVGNMSNAVQHFFTVIVKDEAGNKAVYGTAGNLGESYTYLTNGGVSLTTVSAQTSPLSVSQLQVTPSEGTVAPAGLALVRSKGSRGVISTAGLVLSGGVRTGSVYVDMTMPTDTLEAVKTGIALANPSTQDAEISFSFTDANGVEVKSGLYTLLANHQISGFLDESPFNGPGAFKGMFTFTSSAPISAVGTRSLTQRSGEFLMQSMPIAQNAPQGTTALLPAFVDGGGWSTEVVLTNTSSAVQVGKVEFFGHGSAGIPASVLEMTINGAPGTTFSYSIPPRSVFRLATAGAAAEVNSGSVKITSTGAAQSGAIPNAVAILSFRRDGTTISQTTFEAAPTGTAFRSYVEAATSGEWVNTSLTMVNSSENPNTISLTLTKLDGTPVTSTSITLPPRGQASHYVADLFPAAANGFRGLIRLSASAPVGFAAFRSVMNTAGDILFAATPPQNESAMQPSTGLAFPLVASGAGYDTQVVLFGQSGQAGTGELMFVSRDGVPQTASSLGVTP